ncbi:MAG: ABC transporter ATP-binding protein [Chloroflexi bacterium]|nr:ABC transporter ATP-binding protein [Chloroflexota bacterium]
MTTAVKLESVSKRFILHHDRPVSFQDLVVNFLHRRNGSREEFWALRDLCLQVAEGETLGIIGPNGSGKSTILKLITRVLEPTSGAISVNGKSSALIELGAGFHPDLTGRENVYLNGSILGMGGKEMRRRFDDIVSFAELEQFIDTPVKHYSSGMYMRLGFAVAINVDPDILIIDEVLAVGDLRFQQRCLEAMRRFQGAGKTIILVTHDVVTVRDFCTRALLLYNGRQWDEGDVVEVTDRYLGLLASLRPAT